MLLYPAAPAFLWVARLAPGCQFFETASLFFFRIELWCCGLWVSQGCRETGKMSAVLK